MDKEAHARDKKTKPEDDSVAEMGTKLKNLRLVVKEKENIEKRASETIDFLIGLLTECDFHLLKPDALEKSMVLKCIHLQYDTVKINLNLTHINTEGDLINSKSHTRIKSKSDTGSAGEGRLKQFSGTCSTEQLPELGCPQYWEAQTEVELNKELAEDDVILELGVYAHDKRDMGTSVVGRSHTYTMTVGHYQKQEGIRMKIRREGKNADYLPTTMTNTGKISAELHYGVVYDHARKKIVFIDVKANEALKTFKEVESVQSLWPMFGVFSSAKSTVNMRLVVGKKIDMTEEKKAMILKALSS